ncbi:E3 SUMO-protein ligase ZNF451-like isoform X2 [Dendrobates tinctorius]|uniref:E3 SUMO-protein ligase ZNF451-like isoform X2 n=1 Tax=Dendrobates tinctorius TaxID=92724 RepID=UPI003CC9E922
MNCDRRFDNGQLLLGHLKRFDHSPCDPSIALHGVCDNSYACLLCLKRFGSIEAYDDHIAEKAKLADGHETRLPSLHIQSFACPSCFLLFFQMDECLKHMFAKSHFKRAIVIKDQQGPAYPIPMPAYARNVLIGLCKDVHFQTVCTSCRLELRSYTELTAHFRTRCRKSGPVSISDKSIADVAAIFRLKAYCPYCKQALNTDTHIAKHVAKNPHNIRRITSIEESILAFCYINQGTKTPAEICLSAANARLKSCMLKRTLPEIVTYRSEKFKKESEIAAVGASRVKSEQELLVKAWLCECVAQFPSEQAAKKHIMTANRIFHRCLVCGKMAEDLGIIHLHMSRFHGGAHLSNFRFWCQICRIELVRMEHVMIHLSDCHGGHSFYYEDDVLEQPSTSIKPQMTPMPLEEEIPAAPPQQCAKGSWQCQICEDMFDSEETVQRHCKSLSIHQFHKYICETCKKKFHKLETLLRHCQGQHDGDVKIKYFCGLCEDLYFDEESDFLTHYETFHGLDYGYVPNQVQSPLKSLEAPSSSPAGVENRLTCGCLPEYIDKAIRREDSRQCLAKLFEKGKLWYRCNSCPTTDQTFEGIRSHFCEGEKQSSDNNFVIKCSICPKFFSDVVGAQSHFHQKHCFLEKPHISIKPRESKNEVFNFTASAPVTKKSLKMEHAPTKKLYYEVLGRFVEIHEDKPGSSSVNIGNGTEFMDFIPAEKGTPSLVPEPVSTTSNCKAENDESLQPMEIDIEEGELPDLEFLQTMTHIVFVDLDNWAQFFTHLPGQLNQGTFVWGFQGGGSNWKPPETCKIYKYLLNIGCFFLHPHCSRRKNAADFAICMHAGRLDEKLPKQIPFTILSGGDVMCAILNSIAETTPDPDGMEISKAELDEEANIEEAIRRSLVEI